MAALRPEATAGQASAATLAANVAWGAVKLLKTAPVVLLMIAAVAALVFVLLRLYPRLSVLWRQVTISCPEDVHTGQLVTVTVRAQARALQNYVKGLNSKLVLRSVPPRPRTRCCGILPAAPLDAAQARLLDALQYEERLPLLQPPTTSKNEGGIVASCATFSGVAAGEYEVVFVCGHDALGEIVAQRARVSVRAPTLRASDSRIFWRQSVIPVFETSPAHAIGDEIVLLPAQGDLARGVRKRVPAHVGRGVREDGRPAVAFTGVDAPQTPGTYELLYVTLVRTRRGEGYELQPMIAARSDVITVVGPTVTVDLVHRPSYTACMPGEPVHVKVDVSTEHAAGDVLLLMRGRWADTDGTSSADGLLSAGAFTLKVPLAPATSLLSLDFVDRAAPSEPGWYTVLYVNEQRKVMCPSAPFRVAQPTLAVVDMTNARMEADAAATAVLPSAPFRAPVTILVHASKQRPSDACLALCHRGEAPARGTTLGSIITLTPSDVCRVVEGSKTPILYEHAATVLGPLVGRCGEVLQVTLTDTFSPRVPGLYTVAFISDAANATRLPAMTVQRDESGVLRVADPHDARHACAPLTSAAAATRSSGNLPPSVSSTVGGLFSISGLFAGPRTPHWYTWGPVFVATGAVVTHVSSSSSPYDASQGGMYWGELVSADVRLLPQSASTRSGVPIDVVALALAGGAPIMSTAVQLQRSTTGSAAFVPSILAVPAVRRLFDAGRMPPIPGAYEFVVLAGVDADTANAVADVGRDSKDMVVLPSGSQGMDATVPMYARVVDDQRRYVEVARSASWVVRGPVITARDATLFPAPAEPATGLFARLFTAAPEHPKPRVYVLYTTSCNHGSSDYVAVAREGGDPDEDSTRKLRRLVSDSSSNDGQLLFEQAVLPTVPGRYELVYVQGLPSTSWFRAGSPEANTMLEALNAARKRPVSGSDGGYAFTRSGAPILARSAPFAIELAADGVVSIVGLPRHEGDIAPAAVAGRAAAGGISTSGPGSTGPAPAHDAATVVKDVRVSSPAPDPVDVSRRGREDAPTLHAQAAAIAAQAPARSNDQEPPGGKAAAASMLAAMLAARGSSRPVTSTSDTAATPGPAPQRPQAPRPPAITNADSGGAVSPSTQPVIRPPVVSVTESPPIRPTEAAASAPPCDNCIASPARPATLFCSACNLHFCEECNQPAHAALKAAVPGADHEEFVKPLGTTAAPARAAVHTTAPAVDTAAQKTSVKVAGDIIEPLPAPVVAAASPVALPAGGEEFVAMLRNGVPAPAAKSRMQAAGLSAGEIAAVLAVAAGAAPVGAPAAEAAAASRGRSDTRLENPLRSKSVLDGIRGHKRSSLQPVREDAEEHLTSPSAGIAASGHTRSTSVPAQSRAAPADKPTAAPAEKQATPPATKGAAVDVSAAVAAAARAREARRAAADGRSLSPRAAALERGRTSAASPAAARGAASSTPAGPTLLQHMMGTLEQRRTALQPRRASKDDDSDFD